MVEDLIEFESHPNVHAIFKFILTYDFIEWVYDAHIYRTFYYMS